MAPSCDNEHSKSTLYGTLCSGFLIAYRESIREYQDSDFFPDQLQNIIERCIGPIEKQIKSRKDF